MKVAPKWIIFVCILALTSCITSKQVTYWQDAIESKPSPGSLKNPSDTSAADSIQPDITIQSFDILDVKIKSSKQAFDDLLQSNMPSIYSYGGSTVSGSTAAGGGAAGGTSSTAATSGSTNAYFSGYFVDAAGDVTLPVLGKIRVKNLTIRDAKKHIYAKAKEFVNDPYVEIRFLSFKVQVLGNVRNPGTITISNEKSNIIEALAMAGDLTDFANSKRIKIIRGDLKKNYKVYILDLTSLKNTSESEAYNLRPNDIIYVEPLPRKFLLANIQTIISTVIILNTTIILYRVFSNQKF